MKKIFYRLYTAAFIGICLVPAVMTPFAKADGSKEKRDLAEIPSVKTEDGQLNFEFFSQFESYFSEHFAFRQQLVNADGRFKAAVFGTSPNSDVIVGKDGWLFYGETKDDFLGLNTLDERGINNIAHNLRLIDEYCDSIGAEFIFFSAPNKNSLYPEYMPFNYIPSDNRSNYDRLSDVLEGDGFYLNMKTSLSGLNSATPLYHKTDTHWNNFGAYAGHTFIMSALGRECCGTSGKWYIRNDRLGDLAAMIYPAEDANDAQLHNDYEFAYKYTCRFRGLDDPVITAACEGKDGSLVMYRDSYGEAILPYMAEVFGKSKFSRSDSYDLYNVKAGDTVVAEIVERNLGRLQKYAPVMAAPEADISAFSPSECSEDADVKTRDTAGFRHCYGELPESLFTGSSHRIYITCGGKTYETFNCFEDRLLERTGETSSYGFSAYIPADEAADSISLTVVNDDGKAFVINN